MLVPLEPPRRDVSFAEDAKGAEIEKLVDKLQEIDSNVHGLGGKIMTDHLDLRNNAKKILPFKQKALEIAKALERLGVSPNMRPEFNVKTRTKDLNYYTNIVRNCEDAMKW